MRRLKRLVAAALLLGACARQAPPPGGPPRFTPPRLLAVVPDTGVVPCDFRGDAEFRFDEVTSEGASPNFGYGTGDLERLVLFSPDTSVPRVEWKRDRITVRPRSGWQAHRTYQIELLPGVADLHRNTTKTGHTVAFTTCGPLAARVLSGRVIDWTTVHAAPLALVEAFHLPDSLRYRGVADSTGHFRLTDLPDGAYLVVATIDQNGDHKRGPTEAWDSVRVGATRDTVGEIWTFPRDTLPPRITEVTRQDSQSIVVTFAKPIDPAQRLDSSAVHVRLVIGADTFSVGTRFAYAKALYDSLTQQKPPAPKPDTTAARDTPARRDTTAGKTLPAGNDTIARGDTTAGSAFLARKRLAARSDAASADSTRQDTTARAPKPRLDRNGRPIAPEEPPAQKRPPLGNALVIRTVGRVELGKRYVISIKGVRTADGRTGPELVRPLNTPNPPTAADSAKMRKATADSLAKATADSTAHARADSLKRAGGGAPLAAVTRP